MYAVRMGERPTDCRYKNRYYYEKCKEIPNIAFGFGLIRCLVVYNTSGKSFSHACSWVKAVRRLLLSAQAPLPLERKRRAETFVKRISYRRRAGRCTPAAAQINLSQVFHGSLGPDVTFVVCETRSMGPRLSGAIACE